MQTRGFGIYDVGAGARIGKDGEEGGLLRMRRVDEGAEGMASLVWIMFSCGWWLEWTAA